MYNFFLTPAKIWSETKLFVRTKFNCTENGYNINIFIWFAIRVCFLSFPMDSNTIQSASDDTCNQKNVDIPEISGETSQVMIIKLKHSN